MAEQDIIVNHLEYGIVEFVTITHGRATVDTFFQRLLEEMEGYSLKQTFRFIVNMSESELPPLAYFMGKNRAWVAANPYIPPNRAVILLPLTSPFRNFMLTLVTSLMRGARNPLTIRVFAPHERDNAIFWLINEQ